MSSYDYLRFYLCAVKKFENNQKKVKSWQTEKV